MRKTMLAGILVAISFIIGCASTPIGTERIIEQSREKPKYLKKGIESNVSKDPVWFVGTGESVDLSYAKRLAETNARLVIERSYKVILRNVLENATLVDDNTAINAGRETVKSAVTTNSIATRVAETYWEKIEQKDKDSVTTKYRVYAQVVLPKQIYEKNLITAMEKQVSQAEANNDTKTYETVKTMRETLKLMME